jgi:hypothetical protein
MDCVSPPAYIQTNMLFRILTFTFPANWCKPTSISPSSWITGFSDNSKTFFCAISGSQADLAIRMKQHCCKGAVQESENGCYHWCEPHANRLEGWATCIYDNVYLDEQRFGQACNSIGLLEEKNHVANGLELRPGARPSGGVALGASWKLGVVLGIVGLVQVIY